MIELAHVLIGQVAGRARRPVFATGAAAADAATLRAIVAAERQPHVTAALSRTLRPSARVARRGSETVVPVTVRLAGRDALWLTWILTPLDGATELDLAGQLEARGALAHLAWLLGGRRWLRRRLEQVVRDVEAQVAAGGGRARPPGAARAQCERSGGRRERSRSRSSLRPTA